MKIIILTLCILAQVFGRSSWAWADDLAIAAGEPIVAQTTLTGIIKSVSWADLKQGTKSEIVLIDATKKTTHILVTPTTTLWDKDAQAIMPDGIAALKHVNVIYFTTPEGINVGKSIKILE